MTIEDAARRVAAEVAAIGEALTGATAPVTLEDAVRVTGLPARTVMRRIEDLRDTGVAIAAVRLGAGKAGWAIAGTAAAEGAAPVRPSETRATLMVAPDMGGEG